ncbi:GntR family transcriptional regulator [Candidimonas nitroreducens]|uniref:HTH gntR-type domain-containing protein n=1 Tax=Candidimonas nitroreducens TaxID=683354 RepID=A0A225MD65_9BURK|nr:GntR family transcriptional regulator [Candidimonas nitroreducens]OWT59244.1 hypothetical protein CEY11_13785 [Candidimonas nitroreducens]
MPQTVASKAHPAIRRGRHGEKADLRLKQMAEQFRAPPLGRDQSVPKYIALYNAFLEAIESGVWKPGERLPSEAVMVDVLPMSLGTVQRALQALVEHGIIVRRHGQGSFVAGLPVNANEIHNFRFLDEDGEHLLPVYGRVLSIKSTKATGPWSAFLAGEHRFVCISRLISVNLEFQTFSEVYLPEHKFGTLLKEPLAHISMPLTQMLSERFNAPTLHVTHTISCGQLPHDACTAIGQALGSIGMHWEIFSYTYRKMPSFYQQVFLPLTARRLQFPGID